MSDYALGVITPFAAVAGLAVALGFAYLLVSLARKAWESVHLALIQTVEVKVQKFGAFSFGEEEGVAEARELQRQRRERIRKANLIRDALLAAPGRILAIEGLGLNILITRAYKTREDTA